MFLAYFHFLVSTRRSTRQAIASLLLTSPVELRQHLERNADFACTIWCNKDSFSLGYNVTPISHLESGHSPRVTQTALDKLALGCASDARRAANWSTSGKSDRK